MKKKKKKKKLECFKRNTKEMKSDSVKKKRKFIKRNTKEPVEVIWMLWCGNGKARHQLLSET